MRLAAGGGLLLTTWVTVAKPLGERVVEVRRPASVTSVTSFSATSADPRITQISDGQIQAPSSSRGGTADASGIVETACAVVSAASASYLSAHPSATVAVVAADDAVACLKSIPNVPEHASELLAGLRTYLEFESDLEYLKSPPMGYTNPGTC